MNICTAPPPRHIPIGECQICSQIANVETSFSKYAHPDETVSFPVQVAQLERVTSPDATDSDEHHVKRCPICGIFYQYDFSYEYYVNGSEDEETLTRLTPTQARTFLSNVDYDRVIAALVSDLDEANPLTRSYASRCLASHHLVRHDLDSIRDLLTRSDRVLVEGALFFLRSMIGDDERLPGLASLAQAVHEIAAGSDQELTPIASFVLKCIVGSTNGGNQSTTSGSPS